MLFSLVLAGGLSVALAAPSRGSAAYATFETHLAPPSFQRIGDAPRDHKFTLTIALTQPRIGELLDAAAAIANPANARYGAHLTKEEADAFSAPDAASVEAVTQWLQSQSLTGEWSDTSDSVAIADVSIAKADQMLDTTYGVFQQQDGSEVYRTESYKLPQFLHEHVDFVHPTNMFGRLQDQMSVPLKRRSADVGEIRQQVAAKDAPSTCDDPRDVSSVCLRQLYNTYDYVPQSIANNSIATTGYVKQYASFSDLATFMSDARPDQAGFKFKVVSVAGGQNPQSYPGVEANLDVQTVAGFTAPTPNIFYTTPSGASDDDFWTWTSWMLKQPDSALPKVVSTSYGTDEKLVPVSLANRLCNAYAQLGARGVSLLFSSGDSGVAGAQSNCGNNRGGTYFNPGWPNGCPWITSVGATEGFDPEVAVGRYGGYYGGGGFSALFPAPDWQAADTQAYVRHLGSRYRGYYNGTNRGFPDVSAQGSEYAIVVGGRWKNVGGTSAACPTFSSIIALLNDYRLSQGKPVLGFLNPWLYGAGRGGLNDVTSGSNAGCGTNGFSAADSWDPATGLGTPDFRRLQDLLP